MRYINVPRPDLKKFNARLPVEMVEQIKELAAQQGLSMNATIVSLLQEALRGNRAK